MSNVFKIDDGLTYIVGKNGEIESVQWFKRNQFVQFGCDGQVRCMQKTDGSGIEKHELRQLMIMWLALQYPDCLSFDAEENEDKIRTKTTLSDAE